MKPLLLEFAPSEADLSNAIAGSYDLPLVALSVSMAALAAYAALLVTDRIADGETPRTRALWLLAGALSMGLGIWTMHFVGMLAFHLPIPMAYDTGLTAASMVPGVLASGVALHVMSRSSASWPRLALAGLLMGGGIGAMHYVGMAAMEMPARIVYSPALFALSIAVAHALASAALWVKFAVAGREPACGLRSASLVGSAAIMGCAVAGMHYTAMAAATYVPTGEAPVATAVMQPATLALSVAFCSCVILAIAIFAAVFDRRLAGLIGELRSSEQRTRLILESVGEAIVSTDAAGVISSFNAAAVRMFGHAADEAIGNAVSLLTASPEGLCALVGRSGELEAKRRDGSRFPVMLTVSEYVESGERAFTGVMRDLSEQRALEAKLLQAQKLESIGQLAAGIAHEINTPSQYVGDNLQFCAESFGALDGVLKAHAALAASAEQAGVLEAERQAVAQACEEADLEFLQEEIPRALEQAREGIGRVSQIVVSMKEFSHPGTREKAPVDINRAIASTLTVARNEWKYVADVETDFEDGLALVPCLAAEFNQVVLNIVVNAAHALGAQDEDGPAEKGTIRISTRADGDWVRVEIADDGPGMPEEVRTRVFDPFFTTKEVGKGTGQGLAIAHSVIVDKHGGTIEVDSTPGEGTVFRIGLPVTGEPNGGGSA